MIKIVKYNNLLLFKKDVLSFLEQFEIENNLLLGVLLSLNEKDKSPFLMATIVKNNDIGLVLLQTNPKQIILSKSVSFSSKEVQVIGELVSNTIREIPGLIGEKQLTTDLAMVISNIRGIHASVAMDQKLYKLAVVKKKINSNGKLRTAQKHDDPIIKDWVYEFCHETNQPISLQEADQRAKELINRGNLVLWEMNGKVVSMANAARPTQSNITINFVYTPISERNKGYASDCVTAFTQGLLDQGYKTTSLYTDLSNPTSNKIYMGIGYEPIMESIVILLE